MKLMDLAKPAIDIGLFTNQLEPMLSFWQNTVGVPFNELLPVGKGVHQHRHAIGRSVFKLNHVRDALTPSPASGIRRLTVASATWQREGHSIAAMRLLAQAALPRPVFDFADGGAEDEWTLRRNESAFDDVELLPHPLSGAATRFAEAIRATFRTS